MNRLAYTRRQFGWIWAGAGLLRAAGGDNPAVAKAMESVEAGIAKAAADPTRPGYHFHPPAYWNNDPNGTVWYKGWHHLFYQHNPYGAVWGNMHWGHARSRDLVNWEHLPIALWPSTERGEQNVFSGAAMEGPDGRPWLCYTSIGARAPEQWLAVPDDDDLIVWKKHPANPILTLKHHGAVAVNEWRDPFLFREAGKVYMVCGGNLSESGGRAAVQLYEAESRDLVSWRYRGPVFEYRDRDIYNIECPNLFRLGDKWVLLISPQKTCEYFVGSLDLARARFVPESHGTLDAGQAYASNISFDESGRAILWLWGKTNIAPDRGWNGVMVMPRILTLVGDGYLRQTVPPEFTALRGQGRDIGESRLADRPVSLGAGAASMELEVEFMADTAHSVGLRMRSPGSGDHLTVTFRCDEGLLSVGSGQTHVSRGKSIRLRVFVDKCVAEVYANDGEAAMFVGSQAAGGVAAIEAFAEGGSASMRSARMWPLKPAEFRLERFHV